jgi:outer membrane protein assembly factor BamB
MKRSLTLWPISAVVAVAVVAGFAASSPGDPASAVGQPPPEWAANTWPAHNHDLSNTRATSQSPINSQTVSQLKVKWSFPLKGASEFGLFSSTPIVVNGVVYFQDLNSNVFALDRNTGALKWEHKFNRPSVGPNGVSFGYGRLYAATETQAFALDPQTGHLIWKSRKLPRNGNEGIDMTPQLYDGTVLVSTIPGNVKSFYKGNGDGIVWALDATTGKPRWTFNTVSDGAKLWGNRKINSGGGLWYPPAVDAAGRVFLSVANPAPLYGTKKFPNGSSRPGPDRYTNSIVALDGKTGKRLWFRQAVRHDVRDYDLQIPAIVTTVPIHGVDTEIVLVAGKMGKVYAYGAADGRPLWTRSVGRHQNDTGPLPRRTVTIFPGDLGGV